MPLKDEGQTEHYFRSLKNFATKLSKSQQRHTNALLHQRPLISKACLRQADGGLCAALAIMWLEEQFFGPPVSGSQFPRLEDEVVTDSKVAVHLAFRASCLQVQCNGTPVDLLASTVSLDATQRRGFGSWNEIATKILQRTPEESAVILVYSVKDRVAPFTERGAHAVAFKRHGDDEILFYDSNAGSYLIQSHQIFKEFVSCYRNECLPKKWSALEPGYYFEVWDVMAQTRSRSAHRV